MTKRGWSGLLALWLAGMVLPVAAAERPQDERPLWDAAARRRTDWSAAGSFVLVPASAMEKFLPDELPADILTRAGRGFRLHCARNEAESLQLLVVATGGALREVTARLEFDTEALPYELFQVARVMVERPGVVSFQKPGRWPDPLLPHDRAFGVAAGEAESIWLTFRVPASATPGVYRARLLVTADGVTQTVPVEIEVFPVTLPATPRLKTFNLVYHGIPIYREKWPEACAAIFELLRKNRYSYPGAPGWPAPEMLDQEEIDWSDFDRNMEQALAGGLAAFQWPRLWDAADEERSAARYRALWTHLVAKDWLRYTLVYDFDEPFADQYGELRTFCQKLQQAAPGIPILLTQNPDPAFFNCGVIWCPANTWMDDRHKMNLIRERVDSGDGTFWTYNCDNTRWTFHPDSWRIDWYGTGHRALGVLLWKYGATGYLYWNATYWCDYGTDTPYDLFANPSPVGADGVPRNGDGFLIYPDPAGERMPFPSMRLELNRDAFEDYELLAMLYERTGDDSREAVMRLLPRSDEYDKDFRSYEALHLTLLKQLSQPE